MSKRATRGPYFPIFSSVKNHLVPLVLCEYDRFSVLHAIRDVQNLSIVNFKKFFADQNFEVFLINFLPIKVMHSTVRVCFTYLEQGPPYIL